MSKITKFFRLLFLLTIVILTNTACQNKPETTETKKSKIVIGFSQLGDESTWRARNTKAIQEAANQQGYKLLFDDGYQKQENQIKAIRSFIASRVDVIVLSPNVESGWTNVLQEAQDAGIPVVLSDRKVDSDPYLYQTLVGTNALQEGEKAAAFIKRKFATSKGKVKIVEIAGTPGASSAEDRAKGFRKALGQDSRFEILGSENGDFMLSKGEQAAEKLDASVGLANIDVLFSHNDDMTLGALKYLKTTKIVPGKDLVIVSVDAQQDVVDLVRKGTVNATVECNPYGGEKLMAVIQRILDNQEIEKKYYLPETVFSEFTDFKNVKPRGY